MYLFTRLAALCVAVFGLAGVLPAQAKDYTLATSAGCQWELTGNYGVLNYESESRVTEEVRGTFSIKNCHGIFIAFDGTGSVEATNYFTPEQYMWFESDLQFIALTFFPVDPMFQSKEEFSLVTSPGDLANSPTHLLLRNPDQLGTGILYKKGDEYIFLNIEQVSSPAFSPTHFSY